MIVEEIIHKKNASSQRFNNSSLSGDRIGFWATVLNVNSINLTCDIRADRGFRINNVPILSKTWVSKNENSITGERDMPPVGARVFCLFFEDDISSSIIIGSGIPSFDSSFDILKGTDDTKIEKNNTKEVITTSGWTITDNSSTGEILIHNQDNSIVLSLDQENKTGNIEFYKNTISINSEGISITDCNSNTIETSENSILFNNNLEVLK